MTEAKEVMTLKEAAKLLRLHPQTTYLACQKGQIPGRKVRGQWRFNRATLIRWLDGGFNGHTRRPGDRSK